MCEIVGHRRRDGQAVAKDFSYRRRKKRALPIAMVMRHAAEFVFGICSTFERELECTLQSIARRSQCLDRATHDGGIKKSTSHTIVLVVYIYSIYTYIKRASRLTDRPADGRAGGQTSKRA